MISCASLIFADEGTFLLIGVSGTLQDGFELRNRLDYDGEDKSTGSSRRVPAKFVGKALVRGYKAYFDVKREGWREYKAKPELPRVPNPVVIPTGCFHDANIYWLYLVAPEQVLNILAGEPRFLSITPDTGLVDLEAIETSDDVKRLAQNQIRRFGHKNTTAFALPLVTGVWFDADAFAESPIAYTKEDGTQVTSFDESLALWAGVERQDLLSEDPEHADRKALAWDKVYQKVRQTEAANFPKAIFPQTCNDQVRFGVSNDHLRLNYPLDQNDIQLIDQRVEL